MITPWLLLLVPWAVLVLVQVLSLVALARELPGRPWTGASIVATVGFAVAAVAVAVALGLALRPGWGAGVVALVGLLAAAGAPLAWSRVTGELRPSHHLVRATFLLVCAVFYFWYVAAHR